MKEVKPFPALYATIYPTIVEVGREHGYAVGLHGSLAKDMDVIAVAWTEDASPAADLVEAVCDRVGAYAHVAPDEAPKQRPHGRLSWALILTGGAYIDLSVIPPS